MEKDPPTQLTKADSTSEIQSPTKKKTQLTVEDFTVKHKIGKGAYGDVFFVIKNSDKNEYAMKQIQKRKLQREEKEYQAMVQKELLSVMTHCNIVKLKYAFQDKNSLYFIFDICQGGQFIEFIKLNINKLTEEIRIFYIAQMINFLQYLHYNGITHRDIKPENLMLDKKGHLVLIDFGTAEITNCKILSEKFKEHIFKLNKKSDELIELNNQQQVQDENGDEQKPVKKKKIRRSTFVGSQYYISPQLLQFNYCPPSSDLWALGCILYQLYYLETPFKGSSEFNTFEKIKKCQVSFPNHESITPEAIDLIKRLLVKDPDMRLGCGATSQFSYAKLKTHPYFKGIDIDNIFNKSVPFITDLQEPEKNDKLKKQAEIKYEKLKEMQQSIIKQIQSQGKEVIKSSIIKEKSFLFYNEVLFVVCRQGYLFIISPQQNYEMKQIIIEKEMNENIKLISNLKLQIKTKEKTYHLLSNNSEELMKLLLAEL